MNSTSPSSLRSCATCIETAASLTLSSPAAALTEPRRTTQAKALSCVGVTLRAGTHEGVVRRGGRAVRLRHLAHHALGPLHLERQATEVVQHVVGGHQHRRVLRAPGALGQVARVVRHQQERAAGTQRLEGRARTPRGAHRLAAAGRRAPRGRTRRRRPRSSRPRTPTRPDLGQLRRPASRRPLSSATWEKSTAVTSHPRAASQIALRPSPAARSTARPGGRSASSASTNWFGVTDQTSSVSAYLCVPLPGVHAVTLLPARNAGKPGNVLRPAARDQVPCSGAGRRPQGCRRHHREGITGAITGRQPMSARGARR